MGGQVRGQQPMSRRALLGGAAALLGGATTLLPLSGTGRALPRLCTELRTEVPMGIDELSMAYRRGRRAGKPLLVRLWCGNESPRALIERRRAFADLFEIGDISDIAPLALCESVEACFDDVAALLNITRPLTGLELMLIETTGQRPIGTLLEPFLHIELPSPPAGPRFFCGNMTKEEIQHADEQYAQKLHAHARRIAPYVIAQRKLRSQRLSRAIAKVIAPDMGALSRRANDARAAFSAENRETVERALARQEVPPQPLCHQAAALVALTMAQTPDPTIKERFIQALADSAISHWD